MTNSSYLDELSEVTITDAGLCLMALFLAVFITSANATTVLAIWRTPSLRTLANTYVCSLACADFVVGLACVLMALFMLPPVRLELFYNHIGVCSLFQGIVIGMVLLSAIHMTLIAVDRWAIHMTLIPVYRCTIHMTFIAVDSWAIHMTLIAVDRWAIHMTLIAVDRWAIHMTLIAVDRWAIHMTLIAVDRWAIHLILIAVYRWEINSREIF